MTETCVIIKLYCPDQSFGHSNDGEECVTKALSFDRCFHITLYSSIYSRGYCHFVFTRGPGCRPHHLNKFSLLWNMNNASKKSLMLSFGLSLYPSKADDTNLVLVSAVGIVELQTGRWWLGSSSYCCSLSLLRFK